MNLISDKCSLDKGMHHTLTCLPVCLLLIIFLENNNNNLFLSYLKNIQFLFFPLDDLIVIGLD